MSAILPAAPPPLLALPAFRDNYIWCLHQHGRALVIDPGEAAPVLACLQQHGLQLQALLITHHHADHIGGIAALQQQYPVPVYGPDAGISGVTQHVQGGETLDLAGFGTARVLASPGHTATHISYHLPGAGLLFCGDVLFSAGCGRLLGGRMEDHFTSVATLASLPASTLICCAHEYTLANLQFAGAVEPDNPYLRRRQQQVRQLRRQQRPSLPVSLQQELHYNPFLRSHEPAVVAAASRHAGQTLTPGLATFRVLRQWKDSFQASPEI